MTTDPPVPHELPGRLLGLDFGEKRVGVAVSDPTGTIATARCFLEYRDLVDLVNRLAEWIEQEETAEEDSIAGLVLGDPRHMDGAPSAGSERVAELRTRLVEQLGRPVWLWDERLTSVAAEAALADTGLSARQRRHRVDAVAAALILQGFLEAVRERSRAARDD